MLTLTSPDFINQGNIPVKFTCQGENINPGLRFSNIPDKTQTLVLTLDDPDAPVGDFTHWLLWNINPKTAEIKADSTPPSAVVGFNSTGTSGYIGPCPPSGTHRYIFRLYALDSTLNLDTGVSLKTLISTVKNHLLGQAELIGLYKKN